MFGIGFLELLLIFIVILIFVGPDRLPKLARSLAEYVGYFRKISDDLHRAVIKMDDKTRISNKNIKYNSIKKLNNIILDKIDNKIKINKDDFNINEDAKND